MKETLVKIQNNVQIKVLESLFLSADNIDYKWERLGSDYGGWWFPFGKISSPSNTIVFSAGIGFDVTFDRELLTRGFKVVALDPISQCQDYAEDELSEFPNFELIRAGLSGQTGNTLFEGPNKQGHTSWGLPNATSSSAALTRFPTISFRDLLLRYAPSVGSGFVVKLDIEGFEEEVIADLLMNSSLPIALLVEMDFLNKVGFLGVRRRIRGMYRAIKLIKSLKLKGFRLVRTEEFNFSFVRQID